MQAPDTALVTTAGAGFSLAKNTDKPLTLLFFGYTNCRDICPMVLGSLASGLTRLSAGERKQVGMVMITSDPSRDTEPVLARYLHRFDPTFQGVTGKLSTIVQTARAFGIYIDQGEDLPTGGYDPGAHGSTVFALDASHRARLMWDDQTSSAQFASDIQRLLR